MFKVGDKVSHRLYGPGKVLDKNGGAILVEYDKPNFKFHSGASRGKLNHCWWTHKDELKICKEKKNKLKMGKLRVYVLGYFKNEELRILSVQLTEKEAQVQEEILKNDFPQLYIVNLKFPVDGVHSKKLNKLLMELI